MYWKNALRDELPADKEQVLIAKDGVYYMACYHGKKRAFKLIDNPKKYFTVSEKSPVYWQRVEDASRSSDEF
jgi:hypothetical protein